MSLLRTNRSYFRVENTITSADGSITPGDRLLASHEPTQETMLRLIDSCAFINESTDRAQTTSQGLVRTVGGTNAKSGNTPDTTFTYAAEIKNLPQVREVSQAISDLAATELIKAVADATEVDRNVYDIRFSDEFITWFNDKISTIESDIDANETNISTNTGNISTNTSNISTNTSNISTNTSDISTNTSNISTNTSNISTNTSDITALDSRVTQNETDIAAFGGDSRVIGEFAFMPINTAPSANYLLANGAEISRTTYAGLFALVGTTFGAGNGSTTFNLPNYSGRGLRGYNSANLTDFDTGIAKGNDSITLTTAQLPAHSHTATTDSLDISDAAGTDYTTVKAGDGTANGVLPISTANANEGSGDSIDIKNPYLVTFVFIKAL